VLLVDTDLRRPRLHRTLRLPNDVGVTMAVSGQLPIEECIRETPIENMWVLTSGPIPPNPAEMLASDRFIELTKDLAKRFDRVSSTVRQSCPSRRGGAQPPRRWRDRRQPRLPHAEVRAATGAPHAVDVKSHVIGVVLNAINLDHVDYHEYHYYYTREGYYRADNAPAAATARERSAPRLDEQLRGPAQTQGDTRARDTMSNAIGWK